MFIDLNKIIQSNLSPSAYLLGLSLLVELSDEEKGYIELIRSKELEKELILADYTDARLKPTESLKDLVVGKITSKFDEFCSVYPLHTGEGRTLIYSKIKCRDKWNELVKAEDDANYIIECLRKEVEYRNLHNTMTYMPNAYKWLEERAYLISGRIFLTNYLNDKKDTNRDIKLL